MKYHETQPEKDFVKRTIEIAKEFKDHRYNTTLQINLLFGTVMLPKSHWYKSLDQFDLNKNEIPGVYIEYNKDRITLKVLLHCLRNGIAHWRENDNQNIQFTSNAYGQISTVKITGAGKVNGQYEKIIVTYDLFKKGIVTFMEIIYQYLILNDRRHYT